jgi:hypothetical protein
MMTLANWMYCCTVNRVSIVLYFPILCKNAPSQRPFSTTEKRRLIFLVKIRL